MQAYKIKAPITGLSKRSNSSKAILYIFFDWAVVFFSFYILSIDFILLPISILLIGSRQRAISNLTHEGSHFLISSNKDINDKITDFLLAYPMLETVSSYRNSHMKHHQYLGNIQKDPDSIKHKEAGFNNSDFKKNSSFKVFLRLIFNLSNIKNSFLGSFLSLNRSEIIKITAFWTFLIITGIFFINMLFTIKAVGVWYFSRVTTYHVIRTFAEYMDHSGLEFEDSMKSARNFPKNLFLNFLIHPHHDNYHIVHHLFPKIPHFYLSKAHLILSENSDYNSGHHCKSYFFGKSSAMSCWNGSCNHGTL